MSLSWRDLSPSAFSNLCSILSFSPYSNLSLSFSLPCLDHVFNIFSTCWPPTLLSLSLRLCPYTLCPFSCRTASVLSLCLPACIACLALFAFLLYFMCFFFCFSFFHFRCCGLSNCRYLLALANKVHYCREQQGRRERGGRFRGYTCVCVCASAGSCCC